MAFEQTAQEVACDVDKEGDALRGPDRGRLLNLLLGRPSRGTICTAYTAGD